MGNGDDGRLRALISKIVSEWRGYPVRRDIKGVPSGSLSRLLNLELGRGPNSKAPPIGDRANLVRICRAMGFVIRGYPNGAGRRVGGRTTLETIDLPPQNQIED